jgi:serine/threonine protein phosphatase PrpC
MGGCACLSKSAGSQDDVVNPARNARKRLSVSKSDQASDKNSEKERGTIHCAEEGNILDIITELVPDSQPRLSVRGAASENQQKGFADKKTEKSSYSDDPGKVSRIGYACKKGLKPESPNQDDFCIYCTDSLSIFGVFDGHGPFGHEISHVTHEILPETLVKDTKFLESAMGREPIQEHFVKQALEDAFQKTHNLCVEREKKDNFDCALSGTTATLALLSHKDERLFVGHVGDSRAVLAKGPRNTTDLRSEALTSDHKPNDEAERSRIVKAGGTVNKLEGDIPHRVFVKDQMFPGLAMSRSIGDTVGVKAGVISKPDVKIKKMEKGKPEEEWRFLLVCSDGVWEFISDKEAVDIVASYPPPDVQKGAEALASEAWNKWIEEEKDVVDDITIIVYWFADKGEAEK